MPVTVPAVVVRVDPAVGRQGHGQHGLGRPVLERFVFIARFRPGPGPDVLVFLRNGGQSEHVRLLRAGDVADVEQRKLGARPIKSGTVFVGRAKPDGQQMVSRKRMNVGGNTGNLEFAQNGGVGLIGHVNDPQRIDLLEGHDVGSVAVKASAPDAFAGSDAIHLSCLDQHLLVGFHVNGTHQGDKLGRHRFRVVHPPSVPLPNGGGHAEDTFMFGDGELIEHGAVDASRACVERRIRGVDIEGVEVGHLIHVVVAPEPPSGEGGFRHHKNVG